MGNQRKSWKIMENHGNLWKIWENHGTSWEITSIQFDFNLADPIRPARSSPQPLLLVGSPMCTAFSTMNRINYSKMTKEEVALRMEYGRKHLRFCAKLYARQWRAGRYFLHEHPNSASSWEEQCITDLLKKEGVIRVNADQCMYGLKTHDGTREGPARKGIGFMTNSVCIADKLRKRCPNRQGQPIHQHIWLTNGRARAAQVYPEALCKAICQGLQEQLQLDSKGQFLLMNIESAAEESSRELRESARRLEQKYKTVEEEDEDQFETGSRTEPTNGERRPQGRDGVRQKDAPL